MSHAQRYLALARLISKSIDEGEGPAFLIKLYQEAAVAARAADLAGAPWKGSVPADWDATSKDWVRLVKVLSPLEDLRAREAWQAGRDEHPWYKLIFIPRKPSADWVASHIEFDRYRAVLAIDEATEDIT